MHNDIVALFIIYIERKTLLYHTLATLIVEIWNTLLAVPYGNRLILHIIINAHSAIT